MIFVTVGTQLPFDRLIRGADLWAAAHPAIPVRAQTGQIGPGGYRPRHMEATEMVAPPEFERLCRAARLIVAHAGTGSLLKAAACSTPILIMPRRAGLGEHRNDHQVATAEHLRSRPGVHVVTEEAELGPAIDALLAGPPEPPGLAPFADPGLVAAVRAVVFAEKPGGGAR